MMSISKQDLSRYFQVFIIIVAAGAIYPLVYLRQNFELPILETFNITIKDLSRYYSMIGIMFFLGYLPSGWLSDRISAKLLLSISLLGTGVLGIIFAQVPPAKYLVYIFMCWGITTGLTFWSSHLKCVKIIAKKNEQGRMFGALEGGKGLVEALLATIAVTIFALSIGSRGIDVAPEVTRAALIRVIYMYSFFCITMSVIVMIFLDKEAKNSEEESEEVRKINSTNVVSDLIELIKIPEVWLVAGVLTCGYHLFWATYSFSGYLQEGFTTGTVVAGFITVAKLWMRPIGAFGAGWLGDKTNNAFVLSIIMFIAAFALMLFSFVPQLGSIWFLAFMVIFIGFLTYAIRGLYWAILDTCNLPLSVTGLAIGLISLIGYSSDIFIPLVNGYFVGKYEGLKGYQYYYGYIASIGLIGAFLSLYLYKRIKNRQEKAAIAYT